MNQPESNFLRAILQEKIQEIPDDKLEAVADFIGSCINKKEKTTIRMMGTWENSGFDIVNLEKEIKEIRRNTLANLEQEFGT